MKWLVEGKIDYPYTRNESIQKTSHHRRISESLLIVRNVLSPSNKGNYFDILSLEDTTSKDTIHEFESFLFPP